MAVFAPKTENEFHGALACGLGPGSALTIHRIVIHYRTEALRASRHRTGLAPIRSMRQHLQKSTPKGAFLEAPPGIGPGNKGFADLCLTAWLWRRMKMSFGLPKLICLERITGLEPATSTLARSRSTKCAKSAGTLSLLAGCGASGRN